MSSIAGEGVADLAHVKAGQKSTSYQFSFAGATVDKAFAAADRVFEYTFSSPPAAHLPMEPHCNLGLFRRESTNQRLDGKSNGRPLTFVPNCLILSAFPWTAFACAFRILGGG